MLWSRHQKAPPPVLLQSPHQTPALCNFRHNSSLGHPDPLDSLDPLDLLRASPATPDPLVPLLVSQADLVSLPMVDQDLSCLRDHHQDPRDLGLV